MDDVKSVVRHEISKCEQRGIRDWSTIKSTVRENLRDYIFMKTKRNPMIIPIIMEVQRNKERNKQLSFFDDSIKNYIKVFTNSKNSSIIYEKK